jgi:hypothetical protein
MGLTYMESAGCAAAAIVIGFVEVLLLLLLLSPLLNLVSAAVIPVEIPMERVRRTLCTARALALDWLCPDVKVNKHAQACVCMSVWAFCLHSLLFRYTNCVL